MNYTSEFLLLSDFIAKSGLARQKPTLVQACEQNCTGPLSRYLSVAKAGLCAAIFTDITPAQAHLFISHLCREGAALNQQYPAKTYTDNKYSVKLTYTKDNILYTITCVYLDLGGITHNKMDYDFLLRITGLSNFINVSGIKFVVTAMKQECQKDIPSNTDTNECDDGEEEDETKEI